jgi:large subunit ribosomal protein L1
MATKGKRYTDAAKKYDRDQLFGPGEAMEVLAGLPAAKYDESVDVVIRLGVDPRKADQIVRGTVAMPEGTGKTVRVAVFAKGEAATAAKEAGADLVGADELVAEVEGGMLDFDLAIAAPDMMAQVGKLGRVLGPRGLMPNPKTGTVTPDVANAVTQFKGGTVEYRTDRFANVHVSIGKKSFTAESLHKNFAALVEELNRARPASAKGRYMKKASVSSTMGPGIKLDPTRLEEIPT